MKSKSKTYINGKCGICGKVKSIYKSKKICYQCNKTILDAKKRKKIVSDLQNDQKYPCLLPINNSKATIFAWVVPNRDYGGECGKDIIADYLSIKLYNNGGIVPINGANRQYKFNHKENRYGNQSKFDIETASKLGNVWNGLEFVREVLKYKAKEDDTPDQLKWKESQRKQLVSKFKALPIESFKHSNEANCPRYLSFEERNNMELKKKLREEDEENVYFDYGDIEVEEEE